MRARCDLYRARGGRTAATLFLCAALYGGSTKDAGRGKSAPAKDAIPGTPQPDLIWPLPPDPPRIRWVAEYRDLAKIKKPTAKKNSWVDKLTGARQLDETLELKKPYGIATDSHGRIYIADTELKAIFIIDPAAKTVEKRESTTRAPMALPVGVALDEEDRLFVSDAELHDIICFSASGQPLAHFGNAALGRPGGIALDRQRNRLYVADAKASRIAVFDTATFRLVNYLGGPSTPGHHETGRFSGPTNVAIDRQGLIYVADTWNYRVQVLDPSGRFVRGFGAQGDRPGEFIRPKGIAVDSEGHVYVADAEFNNFQILSPEGQPLLAVGVLGTERGEFALLAGLYVDARNQIYTTEMFRGRVQVFQYIAQPRAERKEVNTKAGNH